VGIHWLHALTHGDQSHTWVGSEERERHRFLHCHTYLHGSFWTSWTVGSYPVVPPSPVAAIYLLLHLWTDPGLPRYRDVIHTWHIRRAHHHPTTWLFTGSIREAYSIRVCMIYSLPPTISVAPKHSLHPLPHPPHPLSHQCRVVCGVVASCAGGPLLPARALPWVALWMDWYSRLLPRLRSLL